jgi:hypothetical protein
MARLLPLPLLVCVCMRGVAAQGLSTLQGLTPQVDLGSHRAPKFSGYTRQMSPKMAGQQQLLPRWELNVRGVKHTTRTRLTQRPLAHTTKCYGRRGQIILRSRSGMFADRKLKAFPTGTIERRASQGGCRLRQTLKVRARVSLLMKRGSANRLPTQTTETISGTI